MLFSPPPNFMLALPEHIDRVCINFISAFGDIATSDEARKTLLVLRSAMLRHLHVAIVNPQLATEKVESWGRQSKLLLQQRGSTQGVDYARHLLLLSELRALMVDVISGFEGGRPGANLLQMAQASGLLPEETTIIHSLRLSVFETRRLIEKVEEVRYGADNRKKRPWSESNDRQFSIQWEGKVLVFEVLLKGGFKLCPRLVFVFDHPAQQRVSTRMRDIGVC